MTKFKDFSKLEKYVKNAIKSSLSTEVTDHTRSAMRAKIRSEVYAKYEPTWYNRRMYSGGLIDKKNIIGKLNRAGTTLKVENITKMSQHRYLLTPLVVYGNYKAHSIFNSQYNYYDIPHTDERPNEDYPYMKPRPFVYETYKYLEESKTHVRGLAEGLERQKIQTVRR